MDIITCLVSGGLVAAVAVCAVTFQKVTPKLNVALTQVENFRKNAAVILGLIGNLELLLKALSAAVDDGKLSEEESKKLLAEAQELLSNPAIVDLRKLLEGE